ncbi:hypothetical protein [Prescottella agglutinans]|uniref:Uncharacterized protein n=1 Tax=Prescottella agglutinans TaxID=1644129 RepID=A0ABT6M4U1_9NOCA|nr:hypothetical protein [Prescottella agglutinans]MDH6279326.1 hypothetical protein [Prescottella agglutinans]
MEPITLPEPQGHTAEISIVDTWLSVAIRDAGGEIRYSAGWDITPTA